MSHCISYAATRSRARHNATKTCEAPGCLRYRHWTHRYCRAHISRNTRYGHPLARPFPRDLRVKYRARMEVFLRDHADAPQVQLAHRIAHTLVADYAPFHCRNGQLAEEHLKRLRAQVVSSEELLIAAGAVYLAEWLGEERKGATGIPADDLQGTCFRMRVGSEVMGLRELPKAGTRQARYVAPKSPRLLIGRRVSEALGVFFVNVARSMREEAAKREEVTATLSAPFTPTAATNVT